MPTQIQGIEFEVVGSGASEAAQALDALTSSLKKLKGVSGSKIGISSLMKDAKEAAKGSSSLKKFAEGLEAIATASNKISSIAEPLKTVAEAMSLVSRVKVSSKSTSLANMAVGFNSLAESVKNITPDAIDKIERMTGALSKLSGVDLKGIGSAMRGVGTQSKYVEPEPLSQEMQSLISSANKMDILSMKLGNLRASLQEAFSKGDLPGAIRIREQILSVEDAIQRLEEQANAPSPALEALKSTLSSMGKFALKAGMNLASIPFKRLTNSVRGLNERFKTLISSLKRIAFYRIIRTIIKEIGQAFKDGMNNLYGWSALVNGKFKTSMDMIATSMLYFKNSIGAAVAPIVNALAPALDFLIDKVVALINVINQLFARLTGAKFWTRAKKRATEYGDAVGGAGQAAKDAIHYLAPFDELNVLPDNKDNGGGGGAAEDFSDMFEEVAEFSEEIKNFADAIREAIKAGDWQGLGTLLGDKVNELIDRVDFAGIGAKVGEKINAWFTTKYWTLETINFRAIGRDISTFLNNMLYEIDFDTLGRTITQPFTNLGNLIIGALETVDWKKVGSSIKDFIIGAFEQMGDFFDKYDWTEVGMKLFDGLNEFISGLDPLQVLYGVVEFAGKLAAALAQIVQGFLLGNKTFIDDNGVEWKFDVNGRLVNLEDKVPKSKKNVDVTAKLTDSEDALTDTAKTVDATARITRATDNTWGNTYITSIADIVAAYDGTDERPVVTAIAQLRTWEKANGFDNTLSGMVAEFAMWAKGNGYSDEVTKMVSVFSKWKKENPTDFNTVSNMVASFVSHMEANKFPATVSGMIAGFASWAKENPDSFNQITGLIARFSQWAKENGFSDELTGFTAVLSAYSRTFSTPQIDSKAKLSDYTINLSEYPQISSKAAITSYYNDLGIFGEPVIDAIANLVSANGEVNVDAVADIVELLGVPSLIVTPGYIDYQGTDTYVEMENRRKDIEGTWGAYEYANGGVFSSSGFWHDIPQFASGGVSHGSMFIAGEDGAELVGHIGGRTEVLNRSQIAATMYASMNSALRSSESSNEVSEDAMYRAFRRALDETDFGGDVELDGDVLYRTMVNRNNRNTRMTGVNAFA